MSLRLMLGQLLSMPLLAIAAPPDYVHPFATVQPKNATDEVRVVVEIPQGGFTKYEIGKDGLPHVDRFLSMPMAYPANYGSMPRTLAGDGDPLDALVLTRAPLHPASVIAFRPIAVLRMVDGGDADEKIIGVPTDKVDATYAGDPRHQGPAQGRAGPDRGVLPRVQAIAGRQQQGGVERLGRCGGSQEHHHQGVASLR